MTLDELLAQRESIDQQIEALRADAIKKAQEAQALIASIDEKLGKKTVAPLAPRPSRTPEDETDYGNGVGSDSETGNSAQSFQDELAELRRRTREKRARL